MSVVELAPEVTSQTEYQPVTGFGPDRRLSLSDCADLSLASSPKQVPDFVLEKDGSVPVWGKASERFTRRLAADSPHEARFTGSWSKKIRARLLRADEQMREWCETTVLLTFTGNPFLTKDQSHPMPPVSFIQALTESQPYRRDAFRRVLDETDRWKTMRVFGAHDSGYPHEHVLVGADTTLSEIDFEPVVRAHCEHSPIAGNGAHGAGAIEIESDPNRHRPTTGVGYLLKDVPGIRSVFDAEQAGAQPAGVVDEGPHRIRMATVLEAVGKKALQICSS